jgi:prevent-host-death family protein
MLMVNIYEVKARLSEYLEAVARGERVLICKRNRPIAELRAVEQRRKDPRPIGGDKGVVVHSSFFDPMPDDFVDAFEAGPIYPQTRRRPSRTAERRAAQSGSKRGKRRT